MFAISLTAKSLEDFYNSHRFMTFYVVMLFVLRGTMPNQTRVIAMLEPLQHCLALTYKSLSICWQPDTMQGFITRAQT
ncbi:hypothetical protein BJB45_15580 [Halomonas huangheensis]|uniref:Uncharacterized protein n=1 Tax=Halomonas huangheensis TaxID=1178482 RepID=W1NAZ5_9GAMM|nr:hypothetical protein AR456_11085 [Halomonas huangheensis]ERL52699.1 hypothetical protein BJB45_15580 [Halomonas huangheensis]